MAWRDLKECGTDDVRAVASPLESERFGLRVERLTVSGGSPETFEAVREAVRRSAADVLILRYPAACVGWFARLTALGRTALFADSLVYWRLAAGTGRAPGSAPGVGVGGLRDPVTVDALVSGVFGGYACQYHANPLFGAAGALAGYRQWARGSAAQGRCVGLYVEGGRAAGLATFAEDGPVTEILLAGVVAGMRGRGLYPHLLKAVEDRAVAGGAGEVVIPTQVHNTRVQKAWARYGFEPARAFLTVHLVRKGLPLDQGTDHPAGGAAVGSGHACAGNGDAEPARSLIT
ncbi:GNAT family N-acetyltransferase [Sphaerisporangium corydalis]|uniref:GNAT family N-acetyltransferase n=1 Tax=Sphaerisporangium corydalis TaxID=1441875 RepID=A0ABV9EP53_9ACTN|nr:GNAT family N-acetyltransferase [Sphaerisporangium corydalis]